MLKIEVINQSIYFQDSKLRTGRRFFAEVGEDLRPDVVVPGAERQPVVGVAGHVHDGLVPVGVVRLPVRPVGVAARAHLAAVDPVPLAVRLVQVAADPEGPPVVAGDCFGAGYKN